MPKEHRWRDNCTMTHALTDLHIAAGLFTSRPVQLDTIAPLQSVLLGTICLRDAAV